MEDKRSGRLVVVSHCIMNVHSLEDDLAIYPGLGVVMEEFKTVLDNIGVHPE